MPEVTDRCTNCQVNWVGGDWETRFELEYEDTLHYNDGPIAGFLLCTTCKRRHAFYCFRVIDGFLFHWVLVPAPEARDYEPVLDEAWRREEGEWLSVVEDLRLPDERRGSGVWMPMSKLHFAWTPRKPKYKSPWTGES
jgi:hypothetical protein